MKVSLRAWRYFSTVFFLFFLLANQSSALPNAKTRDFSSVQIQWQALANCPYIQTAEYHESQLLIHCAKIDLTAPGLKVDLFPKKFLSRETFYVEDICKKSGAILAFNTTPFYVHENGAQKKHSTAGLCMNNKRIYSRPLTSYCALGLFGFETDAPESGRRAKIFSSQKDQELKEAAYASGGFWQILKDKKIIQFKELRDSRTAVGLDQRGTTLFVIAVEGENPSKSAGLTYMECAEFFLALGCVNAMEFDGGSSSQLCVNGKSVLSYKNYVKVPALMAFSFTD